MPDGVSITSGSGTTIASDEVNGRHYQEIRIALGRHDQASVIKEAIINASASGQQNVIAAVSGKSIRLISAVLSVSAQVNVQWKSGGGGNLSGLMYCEMRGGAAWQFNPHGWFQTAVGEALAISLSAAVPVGGTIQYIEV